AEKEISGEDDATGESAAVEAKAKYQNNHLTEEQKKEYLVAILTCMDAQKPYLDPDITIKDLSAMTGITLHNISQVINDLLGKNFFTFMNQYRIQYACALLSDAQSEESIISVCFNSGFNSKSVFNAVFKRHAGVTPSEFRKKISDGK
ncbi:MAG TPA: helix-turn-helix transcriptional regulator, partial [Spirochaetota bacterium]